MGKVNNSTLFSISYFPATSVVPAFAAGVVEAYPQVFSFEEFPVEAGYCSSGLMPLHFNETEAPAFTGKNI